MPAMQTPPIETPAWIDSATFRLPETGFFRQRVPKDLIVLHATASSTARSVFDTWKNPASGRVATAYVVERNGRVYEMFPPDCWAYHLGMRVRNPGHYNDRRSIGIEIVNPGPLRPDPEGADTLNWWPDNFRKPWCLISEKEKYLCREFRGFKYYAAYTQKQYAAVGQLVDWLCRRFGIPRVLPPATQRDVSDPDTFCKFRGIAAHHNFRPDKFDVGPAWDWNKLLSSASGRPEAA
jgi:N-acetyl-anhydromuramyl-L-alanine amidase AmpD